MKKFELTTDRIEENGTILYRIKSLIDFGDVKAGDLGGYVEKKKICHSLVMLVCLAMLGCMAMLIIFT